MLSTLVCLALLQSTDLSKVHAAVQTHDGYVIEAEMQSSGARFLFKFAKGGHFFAKYATTDQYINLKESVTWIPDRREYVRSQEGLDNPLPPGFDVLWPTGSYLSAAGESRPLKFAGKDAIEIPCKATQGHEVRLYADPKTWMPIGSIAVAGGKEYEMRLLSVKPTQFAAGALDFKPPKDAKPFSGGPNEANRLIKSGTVFPEFEGKGIKGEALSLALMLKKTPKGLVVNYWFSSCTGCIAEMPYLVELSKDLIGQQIGFMGVNAIDDKATAARASTRMKVSFPTLIGDAAIKLKEATGVVAHPVTVVIDPNGKVIDAILGLDKERLDKALQKLGIK